MHMCGCVAMYGLLNEYIGIFDMEYFPSHTHATYSHFQMRQNGTGTRVGMGTDMLIILYMRRHLNYMISGGFS